MGLRYIKGLHQVQGERIEEAKQKQPFASMEDVHRRARLDEGAMMRLAEKFAPGTLKKAS